ncbi:MAG: DUF2142 domain-containing protein [Alphaproteobacteria bacterium]|nr:DUF2142 domain-containing protein [Alphaproteobacteria bacterium SS10]
MTDAPANSSTNIATFSRQHWQVSVFVVLALMFGLTYLAVLPPLNTPDGRAHALRIAQLASGQFLPDRLDDGRYGGELSERFVAYADARVTGQPEPDWRSIPPDAVRQVDFSNAAAFTPLAHLPQAAGMALASLFSEAPEVLVMGARFGNLLVFTLLGALAVYLMPFGRVTLALVLLLPFSFSQAATVSADALNLAMPMVFLALIMRWTGLPALSMQRYLMLAGFAVALGLLKQTTPAFALALICLYRPLGGGPKALVMIGLPVLGGLTVALMWSAAYPFLPGEYFNRGADPAAQLATVLAQPTHLFAVVADTIMDRFWIYWHSAMGLFPPVPGGDVLNWVPFGLALLVLVNLLVVALVDGPVRPGPRRGAALITIGALICGGIIAAFWLAFTAPGETIIRGVQGRYLTPAYGVIALGLTLLFTRRGWFPVLRYLLAAECLLAYAATLWIASGFYGS